MAEIEEAEKDEGLILFADLAIMKNNLQTVKHTWLVKHALLGGRDPTPRIMQK